MIEKYPGQAFIIGVLIGALLLIWGLVLAGVATPPAPRGCSVITFPDGAEMRICPEEVR